MKNYSEENSIVIFAESALDRDFYRDIVSGNFEKIFCFENESTCFDNLQTINPLAILLKTEAESVVWRFIFVVKAFKLESAIFISAETFDVETFLSKEGRLLPGIRFAGFKTKDELLEKMIHLHNVGNGMGKNTSSADALMVGQCAPIRKIKSLLSTLMSSDDPVLISGESGVGKESLVQQIISGFDTDAVLIKLNCKAYHVGNDTNDGRLFQKFDSRIDIDLFEKGQLIVIYLDRINFLDDAGQLSILLLIDELTKKAPGALADLNCKVRFIATTDDDMETLVQSGRFRVELYYRLNVIPIHIPPLRHRREDIPLLVDYFLINECLKARKSVMTLSHEALENLYCYSWPNNLDELENIIKRVVRTRNEGAIMKNRQFSALSKKNGCMFLHSWNKEAIPDLLEIKSSIHSTTNLSLKSICEKFASNTEKKIMRKALESTNWNRKKAAALLNISYKSMLNKMKMYEMV